MARFCALVKVTPKLFREKDLRVAHKSKRGNPDVSITNFGICRMVLRLPSIRFNLRRHLGLRSENYKKINNYQ
jgi:hypothetical protein